MNRIQVDTTGSRTQDVHDIRALTAVPPKRPQADPTGSDRADGTRSRRGGLHAGGRVA